MKRKKKMILYIISIILVVLICTTLIILPPSKGKLPKFKDSNGKIIENSISEKNKVKIDGSKLGLIILGENKDNPVLLVCGGGPGIPEYLLENFYKSVLTKYFVVVYFDYRGTGLSYEKVNSNEMTTERYLEDVDKLTDYLKDRFNKEKIYIMGHSFGTYIGLNAAHNHPEKYEAYLAVSQAANQKKSELLAYDYMLEEYTNKNDKKMISKLKKYNVKESESDFDKYHKSSERDEAMHKLGVGTTRNMKNVITGLFFPSLKVKAYTMSERINIWRGKKASNNFKVKSEAFNFNAFEQIDSLEIPIYFFAGKYDYTCTESVQREYYEYINAPEKKYFFYESAAHSPVFEDDELTEKYIKEVLYVNN